MQTTIQKLIKQEFDLDYDEMKTLKPYNVEEANIGILAYDEEKRETKYAKVLNVIKKPKDKAISIKIEGRNSFEEPVSVKHLYAVLIEEAGVANYAFAKDLSIGTKVYTKDGYRKIVDIKKSDGEDWLDLETELGNYYTNGILSHNSPMAHLNSTTGGFAVNFYSSTRFRVSAKEPLTKNGEIIGLKIKIKNYKNKTGIPNRECFLDIYFKDGDGFKKGIDGEGQYLDMLLELGLLQQRGAWYYYRENDPDESKRIRMQGWGGVQNWFKENPKEFEAVKKLVDDKMSGFDENLDKNSIEVNEEAEAAKEIEETEKRKSENTEKLAESALQENETEEN